MKALITFMILSLPCSTLYKQYAITNYIEIKHTGMEEKPIKTLIISTREINKDTFTKGGDNSKVLTTDQKNAILNMQYTFLITDNTTYQSIKDFCNNNQHFFTNNINKNNGDYRDYSIKINGKNYDIFYKFKDQFFSDLMNFIRTKNGDKSVIEKLAFY